MFSYECKPIRYVCASLTAILLASSALAATDPIVPLPQQFQSRPGVFTLCPTETAVAAPGRPLVTIYSDPSSVPTARFLAARLFKATGWQFAISPNSAGTPVRNGILLTTANANSSLGAEGYELTVAPDSVVIRAPASGGVFYGVQSLLQMLPPQAFAQSPATNVLWTIPCAYVSDQPRFSWRGVMLDCSRHFFAKQDIKLLLDAMAAVKLNTFHWHLTDDQGWRLEITNYPALTTNGAWRSYMDYGLNIRAAGGLTNSLGQYGGYYSQADAREIVAYAQQLHITVVPEIEMPCHVVSVLNSYPQFGCGNAASSYNMDTISTCGSCYGVDLLSPGSPGTMAFLQEILRETMAIFPSQYIHCGGDEVVSSGDTQWNSYPYDVSQMSALGITPSGSSSIIAYQRWFSTNIASFVQANGRTMIGWTEFENGGTIPNAALMDWETGTSSKALTVAQAGQKVVMAPDATCYVNYVQSTTALEPPFIVGGATSYNSLANVYGFEPLPAGLPAQYNTNILGAQCTLFTEYVPSAENVMFKIFPRACAMAELTWTPAASKNYSDFLSRLAVHEQRLSQMGVNYNRESLVAIGTWTPAQLLASTSTTNQWDITANANAGEIDVNFWYTNGANSMLIGWTSLLENGVEIDRDTHTGLAMNATAKQYATNATLYVLRLPVRKPGATYQIKASMQGNGGTNCSGIVYLPNWN